MLNIWILNNHYLMLNFETTQTVRRLQLVLESAGWNWKRCAIDDGHYQMVYIWLCNIMYIYIILYHIYIYILYYIIYIYILYILYHIYIYIILLYIYTYNTDLSRDNKSYELSKSLCFLGVSPMTIIIPWWKIDQSGRIRTWCVWKQGFLYTLVI